MSSQVTLKQLLETGVHFGHRTQKWNPKMTPYIFTQRNGIHILDLQQTLINLHQYHDMLRDMTMNGGSALFVGTKRQAQEIIAQEAERCGTPYVNHRWLGGTLTNWRTIRERIDTLKKLESRREKGDFELLTKREAVMLSRKIDKLNERLGGLREMRRLPDVLIVVDAPREYTAIKEANTLNIPVMALLDSNGDPDVVDYIIPGNDDAMRAIKMIVGALADAIIEGRQMRKPDDGGVAEVSGAEAAYVGYEESEDENDERYLGAATLAKLRDANLFDDDEEEA